MSINDQSTFCRHAKLGQHFVAELDFVNQCEIGIFGLVMRFLILNKVAFKRRNTILAEQRGTRTTPKIPEKIQIRLGHVHDRSANNRLDAFEKLTTSQQLPVDTERQKVPRSIHRYAAMKNQALVTAQVHRTMADHKADLLLQFLAVQERMLQDCQARELFSGQLVWVGRINRWKELIAKIVDSPINLDSAANVVDAVQQASMIQLPLRIPFKQLAFQLELHNGRGFLHAGHHVVRPHAAAFRHKELCWIVGVNRASQMFQRCQRNAVTFVQLPNAAVSQRHAEDRADQCFMAQSGPHPQGVMVAPDELHVRLQTKIFDNFIASRPTVPAVSADDQFVNGQIANESPDQMNQMQCSSAFDEFIQHRADKFRPAFGGWRMQQLQQKLAVLRRKKPSRQSQAVVRHEISQQF